MAVAEGDVCCSCGKAIVGRLMGFVFDNHTFKAVEIHGHKFCADHACNRAAWAEFSGKQTAKCQCKEK